MELINIYPKYNSILLVGTYPPPLGGVSIYLKRLKCLLSNNGYQISAFNMTQQQLFRGHNIIRFLTMTLFHHFNVIHVHGYPFRLLKIIMILRKLKKFQLYITDHNPRLFEENKDIRKRINFYKKIIPRLDYLIVVGSIILQEYSKYGVILPKKVLVQPAFIPPKLEEEKDILKTYPKKLFNFLEIHKPIIISNAFRIVFYNRVDLYGLDMCIELTVRLKQKFPNIGFFFALADETNNIEYLNIMKKRIIELRIEDNFYFITGQREIWPLFKRVNLMIRPTYSDGYGSSIAEALYFGCPVVASDVCSRTDGTVLFKNRDLEDLLSKVLRTLKK